MGQRLQLQSLLESLLGSEFVYFQPPSGKQLTYPCIVYKRDKADTKFADDKPYSHRKRYQLMLIGQDPDNDEIYNKIAALPMCLFDRFYTADQLNHDVFNLYF